MLPTVTTSQQRRFLALRNGDNQDDSLSSIGPVLAALRGLTSVAAEGAAKQSAKESTSRPPMEVKARVTDDGRTLFDLKNVSTDGDPQKLAQAAFDGPNERFAQKFMALRSSSSQPALNVPPVLSSLRSQQDVESATSDSPVARPDMQTTIKNAADAIGVQSPDRASVDKRLDTVHGLYRANVDAGRDAVTSLIAALAVKALPSGAERSIKTRIADAQVKRGVAELGQLYGAAAPISAMYEKDRSAFVDWIKHMDTMDGKERDDLMKAVNATPYTNLPEGTDPYAYTAKLAGLDVLPEPFKPYIDAKIADEKEKVAKAAETAAFATKRDERADAASERAVAAAERATNAEARSQERFNVAMTKVAEATKEKPYKFAIGDAEVLQPEYLVSRIGDESSDQPSLQRTLQRQLKKNSSQFDTLSAERKSLSSKYVELNKQLVEAQARMDKNEYAPGAAARVAKLTDDISAARKRGEQIDELRKPLVASIATIQQGIERFSVSKDEWDALIATGETAASLKKQGIRMKK